MDLECAFAAWADRRDPAALTRVFDATAGRMLLLAAHLAGGKTGAEDLVQATFLAAMAHASTWDRRRPLWPWLAGILQNEARMHWRRQERRREVDLEQAAAATVEAPDPQALAASDEAFTALVAAIDALPLPYRQVLRLRLVHGLQPIEIARALEQPVGTVRAQLHRGLAQLRQALPAGLALAAAAWLTGDGALLAQVRAHVLGKATALAAGAGAGAGTTAGLLLSGGWWTMHGKTVGLSATGAALLLLLVVFLGVPPRGNPGEGLRPPVPPAVADLGATTKPGGDGAAGPERSAVEPAPTAAWPLVVTVRTPNGPTAGAAVQVWVGPRGFLVEDQQPGNGLREDVGSGETGADGTFRCALDDYRQRTPLFRRTSYVFVLAGTPSAGTERRVLDLPRATAPEPLTVEFVFGPRAGIAGRVVDAEGTPVAGAEVYDVFTARPDIGQCRVHTAADGSFVLSVVGGDSDSRWPDRIVVGDPRLGCAVAAVPAPEGPPAAGNTVDVGTLVLDGANAIRGQVVLGDGSPLGNCPMFVAQIDPELAGDQVAIRRSFMGRRRQLELRPGGPVQVRASPDTAPDGTFVCAGLDPDAVYAVCIRGSLNRTTTLAVARVGETVRLVVELQLLLLDVRGRDGEALPGATVRGECYDPANERPSWSHRPGFPAVGQVSGGAFFTVDARGRRMILSPFEWIWCLYVTDEISQSVAMRHDAAPGVYRVERSLVLQPALQFGALRLVVVDDDDGRPARHYGFRMQHCERDVSRNYESLVPPADCTYRELPAGRWRLTVMLGAPLPEVFGFDTTSRGTQEQEIVIADGRTTEVRVVSSPAGRIAFRLHADRAPESGSWPDLKIQADVGGADVGYEKRSDDQWASPWPLDSIFYLAEQSFPPGRHGFLITVEGYRPAHCEVEVTDRRLTQARVELLAR